MTTPNDHHANPDNAATDPAAAAKQDQVRADHDALQESARRVEASAPANVRDPREAATDTAAAAKQDQTRADHDALQESARRVEASQQTTTDASAAATQDRVKADHDALEESARRVKSSVSADVRNTPVQPSGSEDRDRR